MNASMEKTVGINGISGRIGKFSAYEMVKLGMNISAVNDLASTDHIVEALSHRDSVHGKLDWDIKKISDNALSINGRTASVYHEADPSKISWGEAVGVVAECTGAFTKREKAELHFANTRSLDTVIISAPSENAKTIVMGVNHADYVPGDRIISNASCTTKALALPLKVLLDYGISIHAALMDTTHAATNTQRVLDFMATYGTLDTIQSSKTGAAVATGKVLPSIDGLVDGFSMRVPTRDGSFANVYVVAERYDLTVERVNSAFRAAKSDERYLGRLDLHDGKEIATTDIVGNSASAVIALSKTKVIRIAAGKPGYTKNLALVGFVSGYDNERGPSKDLALLAQYVTNRNAK